jgi:AraC family transcriptional regulator
MNQAGAYGRRLGQFLHLKDVPPLLTTRALRGGEIAVTETRDDQPLSRLSGTLKSEDAYLISLKLRDYPDCEIWERGKHVINADIRAGATYLYDLKRDPRYLINKPFHSMFFYLPRSALDGIAEQSRTARIGGLSCKPGIGHDDAVIRHISATLREGMRRPDETNQLFVDHMMLALTAHVARAYGDLPSGVAPSRGSLAPWQTRRACERIESTVGGRVSLAEIAAEFGYSPSHFARAFKISTGLPPHQWLLRQRVNTAKQLMTVRALSLTEIAMSAGFANQSHFTRVFSAVVGVSPAAWRRDVQRK